MAGDLWKFKKLVSESTMTILSMVMGGAFIRIPKRPRTISELYEEHRIAYDRMSAKKVGDALGCAPKTIYRLRRRLRGVQK